MRLEHLEFFVMVARSDSLTLASKNLFCTPQTLSTAIKNMEQELGTQLFYRSGKGMVLTSEGKNFLIVADKILTTYRQYQATLKNKAYHLPSSFRVWCNSYVNTFLMPTVFLKLHTSYPAINFFLSVGSDNRQMIQQLNAGELDVAVILYLERNNPKQRLMPHIEFVDLCPCDLAAFINADSPLLDRTTLSLEDLQGHQIAVYCLDDGDGRRLSDLLSPYGQLHLTATKNILMLKTALANDVNIVLQLTLFEEILPLFNTPDIIKRPLQEDFGLRLGYCYNKNTFSPYTESFITYFLNLFG